MKPFLLKFDDESRVHKYSDIKTFPFDFKSDKKVDSKKVTVDGKIGDSKLILILKKPYWLTNGSYFLRLLEEGSIN